MKMSAMLWDKRCSLLTEIRLSVLSFTRETWIISITKINTTSGFIQSIWALNVSLERCKDVEDVQIIYFHFLKHAIKKALWVPKFRHVCFQSHVTLNSLIINVKKIRKLGSSEKRLNLLCTINKLCYRWPILFSSLSVWKLDLQIQLKGHGYWSPQDIFRPEGT